MILIFCSIGLKSPFFVKLVDRINEGFLHSLKVFCLVFYGSSELNKEAFLFKLYEPK